MYEIVESNNKTWAVDWELVRRIVLSNEFWSAVPNHRTAETHFVDKPCLTICVNDEYYLTYKTDWTAVRKEAETNTASQMRGLMAAADRDMTFLVDQLGLLLSLAREAQEAHLKLMKDADKQWRAQQTKATGEYANAIKKVKFLRDGAAEFVVVGSTIVTGGATAVAFGALGSGLKGVATYQDTGNSGAAIFEASTSMLLTAVPIARGGAKNLTGTDKAVLITLDSGFEGCKSVMAGDQWQQAIVKSAVKAAGSQTEKLVGPLLKSDAVRDMLSQASLPASISVSAGSDAAVESLDLIGSAATWTVNSQLVAPYASGIIGTPTQQERTSIRERLAAVDTSTVACIGTLEGCADRLMVARAVFPIGCVATP